MDASIALWLQKFDKIRSVMIKRTLIVFVSTLAIGIHLDLLSGEEKAGLTVVDWYRTSYKLPVVSLPADYGTQKRG